LTELEYKIKNAQKGNEQAFKQLFDAFSSTVFSVCMRYLKENDDAKDLMQEVFIRLFSKLSDFKFQGSFEGWLKRMTVHMAIDKIRKEKNWLKMEELNHAAYDEVSEIDILSQMSVVELLKLIKELPPAYGLVFNMYVIEGYKHAEISDLLGISVGTSKSNLHDARKILQKRINIIMNG
jgi:RNA polymerase sigma factor (sigma-70 family)